MTPSKVLYPVQVHVPGRGKNIFSCETPKVRPPRERCDIKSLWLLQWYRILRVRHEWTIFQAIQFALWLTR